MKKLKWSISILIFVVILTPVFCLADIADQLNQAAMENNIQMVNDLIAKGADVNAKSHYGLTDLYVAIWNGNTEVVKILIKKGADVNEKSDNGETALSIAQSKNHSEIIQLLMQAGAK